MKKYCISPSCCQTKRPQDNATIFKTKVEKVTDQKNCPDCGSELILYVRRHAKKGAVRNFTSGPIPSIVSGL